MKATTRKESILRMLRNPKTKLTCGQMCKKLIAQPGFPETSEKYLSGSISSLLHKLVRQGVLIYAEDGGPKGGFVYQRRPLDMTDEQHAISVQKQYALRFERMKAGSK